jgi:hypothetical protein
VTPIFEPDRLVFAGECRYCFRVDLAIASGTVWSLAPMVSKSRPRSGVAGVDFVRRMGREARRGLQHWPPARRDRPFLVGLVGFLFGDGIAEAEAELLGGERDRLVLMAGFLNTGSVACNAENGSRNTPLTDPKSVRSPDRRWFRPAERPVQRLRRFAVCIMVGISHPLRAFRDLRRVPFADQPPFPLSLAAQRQSEKNRYSDAAEDKRLGSDQEKWTGKGK